MKKLLFMLLCCTVFVVGCNKESKVDENDQMESSEATDSVGESIDNVADQSANEGKVALEAKDYAKSVAAFTKALESKEIGWVYADRGRAKVLLGDKEGALADFTKAIELEQRDVYYEWRAALYTEMGNTAAAQADTAQFEKLQKEVSVTK